MIVPSRCIIMITKGPRYLRGGHHRSTRSMVNACKSTADGWWYARLNASGEFHTPSVAKCPFHVQNHDQGAMSDMHASRQGTDPTSPSATSFGAPLGNRVSS